jgi:hypothetical protein
MRILMIGTYALTTILTIASLAACADIEGPDGARGPEGEQGPVGPAGEPGPQGEPGDSAKADAQTGSRLKRRFRTGSDGSRAFDALFDPEMGMGCTWLLAADGSDRCLPFESHSVPIALRYLDAECKEGPIALIREVDCGTLPPFLTYQDPGECFFSVRALGPAIAMPEGEVYEKRLSNAGPICWSATKEYGSLFYGLHDETLPGEFVSGTWVIE